MGNSMQIGATSWGQQWTAPSYDLRTGGMPGRGTGVPGSGTTDPLTGVQQVGDPSLDGRSAGATERKGDARAAKGADGAARVNGSKECQTCKSRKYSDRSSDPTVSFQTPTSLSPEAASTAVRAHEQEHVSHEQARAQEKGLRVVAQSVSIHSAICPECGRSYVSGGTTTTTTRANDNAGYTASGKSGAASSGGAVNRLA
jgi:hypothetical protein